MADSNFLLHPTNTTRPKRTQMLRSRRQRELLALGLALIPVLDILSNPHSIFGAPADAAVHWCIGTMITWPPLIALGALLGMAVILLTLKFYEQRRAQEQHEQMLKQIAQQLDHLEQQVHQLSEELHRQQSRWRPW